MFATADKDIKDLSNLPVKYSELSWQERKEVRLRYSVKQEGVCYYCENRLDRDPPKHIAELKIHKELFPDGFFDYPIHLHHHHITDMTIGAVHAWCNAVLWEYCYE